jgi:hypothetical protein
MCLELKHRKTIDKAARSAEGPRQVGRGLGFWTSGRIIQNELGGATVEPCKRIRKLIAKTATTKYPTCAVGEPNHLTQLATSECKAVQVARAFFQAATMLSDDNEDILPQVGLCY